MDRKRFPNIAIAAPLEYGKPGCSAIDQTPARDFNIDPATGRPMEEITRVMRAQTQAEMQNAFMNLNVFSSTFLPDDTSAKEALKFMKPSLCQLPSELAEWSEALAKYQYDQKLSEIEKKKAEEEAKKAEEEAAAAAAVAKSSSVEPKSE